MRSADEDREISPQQLRGLMLSTSDSIVNIEANNQELTSDQLKTLYLGNHRTLRESTFKQNLNLLTRDGTYNLMAAILADVNSYSIKVAVFRGTDKTNLIKRNEYGYKCMLVAVKQVLDYIEQTGHGVPLIVSRYGKEVFDISENFITVTIPLSHKRNTESSFSKTGARTIDGNDDKIPGLMKEKRFQKDRAMDCETIKDDFILVPGGRPEWRSEEDGQWTI